jgi:hypothetical protein
MVLAVVALGVVALTLVPIHPVVPRRTATYKRCGAAPILARREACSLETDEMLDLFSSLSLAVTSQRSHASYIESIGLIRPSGGSSPFATDTVMRAGKRMLATNMPAREKQDAIAALIRDTLRAGRVRSALLLFELAERRVRKWITTSGGATSVSSELVLSGLLCTLALRDRAGYERVLAAAQGPWNADLISDASLLSEAMVGCCDAGWPTHADAIRRTLVAAGLSPTTAAFNALMASQLRSGDPDGAIETFLAMRDQGLARADGWTHALATQAAATRKATWKGLRNLLNRKWLKVPFHAASANAAVSAFIRAGNMPAAAAAVAYMQATDVPLMPESYEALLWHAAVRRECSPSVWQIHRSMDDVFGCINQDGTQGAVAVHANVILLVLPHLPARERLPFCVRALSQGGRPPPEELLLQAAIAILRAHEGDGDESATWLLTLLAEGVDLEGIDREGRLALLVSQILPDGLLRDSLSLEGLLGPEGTLLPQESSESGSGSQDGNKTVPTGHFVSQRRDADGGSLWSLCVRACGTQVEAADALCQEMQACGELDVRYANKGVETILEFLRVCERAREPNAAVLALRKLEDAEVPVAEAYVRALAACCSDECPNMALATATLDQMDSAGALSCTTPGQMLRLYVALIRGYGRRSQLDDAHGAFLEGQEWLSEGWQKQVRQQLETSGPSSKLGLDLEELSLTGSSDGPVRTAGIGLGKLDQAEWGEAQWQAAERALHRTMVEAAAPHPRGLLLACTLLEQLGRNSQQKLKHAYYSQLISGHATANELHVAMASLQSSRAGLGGAWQVSDATIATLMDALSRQAEGLDNDGVSERARDLAVQTLAESGLQMDSRVTAYLASKPLPRRRRQARTVNANDELAASERGGSSASDRQASNSVSVDMYGSSRRAAQRIQAAGRGAESDPLELPVRPDEKLQYDEFERLLAQRDERAEAASSTQGDRRPDRPQRDTKRSVDGRRLENLGPL